mmetsp:Transcript_113984/g.305646  ORF Transcript_113984/g.305646 Transcript_113984/m.305646 type:complete len:95 (-) Transcript_113984:127-411(-)
MSPSMAVAPACDETGVVFDTLFAMTVFVLGYLAFTPKAQRAMVCVLQNVWDLVLSLLPVGVCAKVPSLERVATHRSSSTGVRVVPMAPINVVHA